MAVLVTADNCKQHEDLLEAAYRFRHRHFVERLGWEALRRPDGREYDQFDGPHCVHAIGAENGAITHYVRLLPTERPHLLSHVYPQLMQGNVAPTGPRIYEWTRGSVDPNKRGERRGADPIVGKFYVSVIEATIALGLEGLVSQCHPVLLTRIAQLGWDLRPLALPSEYDGQPLVPFYVHLKPDTLATARQVYGFTEPVLDELPSIVPPRDRPARPALLA